MTRLALLLMVGGSCFGEIVEGPGSARYAATVAVDTSLSGRTLNVYTTLDHLAGKYVRSTNCWAYGFDLSCVAVYNSQGMGLSTNSCCPWERPTRRAGTLISPRHLLYANHYPIEHGSLLRFVSKSNTVVTRTLADSMLIKGSDLHVGLLDADVPTNWIGFAKVLPPNFTNYFPTSLSHVPTLCFNHQEQALVTDIGRLNSSGTNATMIMYVAPADVRRKEFYLDKISGDSGQPSFMILDSELVLLTVWTGGGAGTGSFVPGYANRINAAMKALGGRYTLTPVE